MAANTSSPVQLLFRNRGTLQGDQLQEIYPSLKEKSRGIRVFYFSTTAGQQHCDHGKHHNQSWKTQLEDGRSLEAGTVITLTDFEFPAEYRQQRRQYLVVIQWDCGFVKAYSKQELDDIRVFDLGPTGKYYPFSAHFEHCKPVNKTARAWVRGYNPTTTDQGT